MVVLGDVAVVCLVVAVAGDVVFLGRDVVSGEVVISVDVVFLGEVVVLGVDVVWGEVVVLGGVGGSGNPVCSFRIMSTIRAKIKKNKF